MNDNLMVDNAVNIEPEGGVGISPPQFHFNVSSDKMTVYLRIAIFHRDQTVTKDDILNAMEKTGLKYGIDNPTIDAFLEQEDYLQEIRVASGKRPVKGANGAIIFHFNREFSGAPKEREDGTVDFKSLDLIQNVSKGDSLCTIIKPKPGIDGVDVYGGTVVAETGDIPPIPGGENVLLTEDGTKLIANADGGLHYRNNTILIDNVFQVEDVGVETGNIDFNGSVVVRGMVQEGFAVKAKNDITVRGTVEGATLHAGGNIEIRIGINGMSKADIFAEGDVISGFIENATVKCGGSIFADTVVHSRLRAGISVRLRGKRGALIGGSCVAGENINVKSLGSDKNILQDVTIEPMWYEYEKLGYESGEENPGLKIERLEANIKKLETASAKLTGEIAKLQRPPRAYEEEVNIEVVKKALYELLLQKNKINEAMGSIHQEIRVMRELTEGHDFRIICIADCHPGTKINISGTQRRITELISRSAFRVSEGEVVTGEVFPSDIN